MFLFNFKNVLKSDLFPTVQLLFPRKFSCCEKRKLLASKFQKSASGFFPFLLLGQKFSSKEIYILTKLKLNYNFNHAY